MWFKPAALLGVIASLLLVVACSGDDASDDRPRVIASFYPFAFVAEQVGGDTVQVDNLTQPGAEPHDLELDPQQVADLTEASLVVFERGFQPAVDDGIDQAGVSDDATLDVADVVTLSPADEGSDEEGDFDPHVWLDPVAMQQITEAVVDRMIEIDPDHQRAYERNRDQLLDDLRQLDNAYEQGLADCERRTIVTSHDAFGYLARRYDLEQIPIAGIDPHAEPAPSEQAEISDLVEQDGITTVFTETLVSDDVAESIADETGVAVATLDPIEGLSDDTSDDTYLTLMRSNLETLREANGCT
ncbi:MAG TPA: metal ABC transporter substrate-binding protein [Nocardioidaceae bacterium]|nr:metal ABC transporter substrate-binding protein [Nocardioidaceae bacterium]